MPPPPTPRPEDLLVPNQSPVTAEPASWGWRGRLNRGSGGLLKSKPAAGELAARRAIADIQRGFSRPMTIVVVQPKGGAGKTPTTICLSAAFGAHRGGYVVGWDDNETRGTLAVRVSNPDNQRATVWDLLRDLAAFERFDARVGDLSRYVRPQPDSHFDALVSDDNPGNMAQIGEEEFHRLHKVLQRFYRLIVVDTGNNVRSPNWQAAVSAADLVVVVSTYQRDVGYSGSWVLDHLAQTGREELARNAVTVLSAADPTHDKAVRDQLVTHFETRTRAVVEIPYDAELAHGGPIRWTDLAPATRNAWVLAGATIINALAERDQQAIAERRI
jgi:MinD-like ATPase involved in chromosome partitioning or flagellar assembly